MTTALWWALAGVAAGSIAPVVLRSLIRRGTSAAALLGTWGVMVCLVISALAVPALVELAHRCSLTVRIGDGRAGTVVGVLSAAVLLVAGTRAAWRLRAINRSRRRLYVKHFELTWLLTGSRPRGGGVLWLPVADPLAYSLAGHPAVVVATRGLRGVLDDAAVSAVLAHERAHVARRHHRLVALADAVAAGLGWLPLMRQSPSLVRMLVELDADAHAARIHGHRCLIRALRTLQRAAAPPAALGIAGECTQLRLDRLGARQSAGAGRLGGAATRWSSALIVAVACVLSLSAVIAIASCSTV
ncbi:MULTISPECIES: M56 family metallopeptidase [Mycolicibacterium]|uniref:M56 family metallopeptidase n=1 Tax=Mycolicibacterium TaxID=1866885 RepID=UPI001F4302CC|nr:MULTISPECIES: M56 family metallopeptidase [Mycolicibacterium]